MISWLSWCNQFTGNPDDCAFNRVKPDLSQSDVDNAIAWYEKEFGKLPNQVAYRNNRFKLSEKIEFIEHHGVMGWELYMTWPEKEQPEKAVIIEKEVTKELSGQESWGIGILQEKQTPAPPTKPPDTSPSQEIGVAKVGLAVGEVGVVAKVLVKIKKDRKPVRHGIMGRPPKFGQVCRTTLWRRAQKLKKQGEKLL